MNEPKCTDYCKSASSVQFDSLLYFPASAQNYQRCPIHFYLVSKRGRRKPLIIPTPLITRTVDAYYVFQNTDETLIKKISPFLAPFLSIQDNSVVANIQLNIQFVEYNDTFDIPDVRPVTSVKRQIHSLVVIQPFYRNEDASVPFRYDSILTGNTHNS